MKLGLALATLILWTVVVGYGDYLATQPFDGCREVRSVAAEMVVRRPSYQEIVPLTEKMASLTP